MHTFPLRSLATLGAVALLPALAEAQGNRPPAAPVFTEPSAPSLVLSPFDVHMETAPFSDPDPGDGHAASDWAIWTVSPLQRVWHASGVTGVEKLHAHLGDGVFEGSHFGWTRLYASTLFELRVRHKDDSGDPSTEWSPWSAIRFTTDLASKKVPLELDDVAAVPEPIWRDPAGAPIELPTGAAQPSLRVETASSALLLRIDASAAPGNTLQNPGPLARHEPVRVVVDAGDLGRNLVLPESELALVEHACRTFTLRLPAWNLLPRQTAAVWVSAEGASYIGTTAQTAPDFRFPARGLLPPWVPRQPGYTVEIMAQGLRMPVNLAFVPNPGTAATAPKLYVTELYGTVRTITNDGTVLTYVSGLLDYTPSGLFPGSGEQGLTGIAVDPATGDVFVGHLRHDSATGNRYPRIVRLRSLDGGRTAATQQVILDMPGEWQGQSHQISCLEIVRGELYCHMGDGFTTATARSLTSYRGKILRLALDGAPLTTNPFYNGGTRDARDYVWAYGVRNPFGGAWRALDDSRYVVENGPGVDRFAKIVRGRDYLWSGTDASMRNYALYNWSPATGPVNLAFVQQATFGGSGFPPAKMDHAFVTESGPTYAAGQQQNGKRITEFVLDAAGNRISGPAPFVEYVGDGRATAVGLAAGPDGLWFTDFYKDENTTGPTDVGGRVLRVRHGAPDDCNHNGAPDQCEIAIGAVTDFDRNGVPDECDPLAESTDTVSLATGGTVAFTLDAGAARAGHLHLLAGSLSGTSPGTPFGGFVLPLNSANDPWFTVTLLAANSAVLVNTFGTLDPSGRAVAALVVPNNWPATLVGTTLHHAYVTVDPATFVFSFTSNAVPLRFVP